MKILGIDLGTTNSALAVAGGSDDHAPARPVPITQVVGPGEIAERPTLPSFLLLPNEREVPPAQLQLPWSGPMRYAVGTFARERGAELPHRLVSSAKSWLCNPSIERTAQVLPFRGAQRELGPRAGEAASAASGPNDIEIDGERVSPVNASARYLAHLRAAWDDANPDDPAEEQEVLVTVPASFDPVARELTVVAAREAGFERVTLLEEPQAALYAYLAARGDAWRKDLAPGDVVLVCDIGGGTTDFSLIAVRQENGVLQLERVAVGDHILLGGDNMDLALAYAVQARMEAEGTALDDWQLRALTHGCRAAKEALLGEDGPPTALGAEGDQHEGPSTALGAEGDQHEGPLKRAFPLAIAGRSSKLIGGTLRTELQRAELDAVLLDGFFPEVAAEARPQTPRRMGLTTLGLPYPADAAITRHLAKFLGAAAEGHTAAADAGRSFVHPTAILFNGGVTRSPMIRERIGAIVTRWVAAEGGAAPKVLEGIDAELAVSHGAAYYARMRRDGGVRIRGGTVQAFYVGIERSELAVPGIPPRVDAVCVAPFGMEEGSEVVLPQAFGLVVGEPVSFRFFGSSSRRDDAVGTTTSPASLSELPPIETTLDEQAATQGLRTPKASEQEQAVTESPPGQVVQVRLHARVTEVGTLELSAVEDGTDRRWKLSFDVRGQG
jgi:molecular chaperone DnaK (HSP70)